VLKLSFGRKGIDVEPGNLNIAERISLFELSVLNKILTMESLCYYD
jgi:hypothetical protein